MSSPESAASEPTLEVLVGKYQAALCVASGRVTDRRRLVAYLYLLMRDHVPFGPIGNALHELTLALDSRTSKLDVANRSDANDAMNDLEQRIRDRSARLCDAPTLALVEFFRHVDPLTPEGVWSDIDVKIPLRDDIETTFTNGWIAHYAQWIADRLVSTE